MINIYVLICSNRKNGSNYNFSKKIIKKIEFELKKRGRNVNILIKCINQYNVRICSGCQECFHKGRCTYNDDQLKFIEHLKVADIVVFCVPVYINNIPGNLKVLLDRIGYLAHLMPFLGKSGIILTTSSLSGMDIVEGYMEMIFSYLGISADLKLRYYDIENELRSEDEVKLDNYIDSYLKQDLEIPTLLRAVFNHYYNHYTPYKNKKIDNNELKYWQNNYLNFENIEDVLCERRNKKQ